MVNAGWAWPRRSEVHGFPVLGLLQVLRPTLTASTGDESSRRPAGCWPVTGPSRWFPRSFLNRSTGSAPKYAPATSPRLRRRHSPWPPDRRHHPIQEFPDTTSSCGCALLPSPDPPGSSWWFRLERRSAAGSLSLHLSVLLAGPRPSGSAGPSRRCQGCCPPSLPSRRSGCPQLQSARCDELMAVSFHDRTVQERLVALEIADPQLARSLSAELTVHQIWCAR